MMTYFPPTPAPPRDPAILRRRASSALLGATLLWVLVGVMILGALGRATSGPITPAPSSGAEALGRLVGMIGFPIAAAIGAIALHRRRRRLLRQARAVEAGHGVVSVANHGHFVHGYPPHYPPPGSARPYSPPPKYSGPHQRRSDGH
ncbi:hypothetical protein L1892_00280 [Gordonia sp. GW1C4-4]|uniref:Uncharacterized protein n=2 Tax=Gordoniaceae TaxID=85026 RepID=A0ABS9DC85_9ACTN|nr:hypothetical protein [Gordonia sp. (in: high G+C Gram-positive bacteria)]MCF3936820.1 hypothetical protein [Gordonia tangerina]